MNERYQELMKIINEAFPKKRNSLNLSAREVAIFMGVSPSHIENQRDEGVGIDYIEMGGRYLYEKKDVVNYIINNKIKVA